MLIVNYQICMSRWVADWYSIVVIMFDVKFFGCSYRVMTASGWNISFFIQNTTYNRGQFFWLTTIPFLFQKICSSVRIVVPGAILGRLLLKFWVTVCFMVEVLWIDGESKGKVVLNLWPNNLSAGEVPLWFGYEFRDSTARKWSSELGSVLLRVRLTVWLHLSAKPFDWWQWGLIVLCIMSQVFENEPNLWLEYLGPLSKTRSLSMTNCEKTFLHLLITVSDWGRAMNFE